MTEEIEVRDAIVDPDPDWHPWYGPDNCYCGEDWCGSRASGVAEFVNLCPHAVTVAGYTWPAAERPARIEEVVEVLGDASTPDGHIIPRARAYPQRVVDLPPPAKGVQYIVSRAVAAFCPDREDLWVPDGRARDASGQQTGGAARLIQIAPTLRATLAELQAIDLAMPHEPDAVWPDAIFWRRRELVLRLADLAIRAGWIVGWDHDPDDPRLARLGRRERNVQVVVLPDGREIRKHSDAVRDGGGTVHRPWDGQTTRADVALAVAEYLTETAS